MCSSDLSATILRLQRVASAVLAIERADIDLYQLAGLVREL